MSFKIAVASGKGGTGKTFVATNLFYALWQKGHKVTLLDCDAEAPNALIFFKGSLSKSTEVLQKVPVIDEVACVYCSKCHEYCNYNAIFLIPHLKVIHIMEELCHGCGACTEACAYKAVSEKDVVLGQVQTYSIDSHATLIEARMKVGVYSPVSVIKAGIRETPPGNIVIMDAPPGTSCPFIHTVTAADYVVLVAEPTPFGLSDLKQSVETLRTMNKAFGIIINRAGLGNDDIRTYITTEKISLLMNIPFDRAIATSYSRGEIHAAFDSRMEQSFFELFLTINTL